MGVVSGLRHSRTSMIAGYSRFYKSLIAPTSYKGTTNTDKVLDWFEYSLLPQLQIKSQQTGIKDFVIILDRASIHKSNRLKELVESYEYTLLLLSPYSPDYNPIEHVWWQLKRYLVRILTTTKTFYQDIENGLRSMAYLWWG